MKLIFETSDGDDDGINQFTMEVSNSDSVPQIKQKIQQLKGFPISTQTLCFNGAVLPDDFNLRHSPIVHGSTIHLHLRQHIDAAEATSPLDQIEDLQPELDEIARNWGLLPSPPSSDQTPIQPHAAVGNQPPTSIHQQSPIHPAGDDASTAILHPFPIRGTGLYTIPHQSPTLPAANVENSPSSSTASERQVERSNIHPAGDDPPRIIYRPIPIRAACWRYAQFAHLLLPPDEDDNDYPCRSIQRSTSPIFRVGSCRQYSLNETDDTASEGSNIHNDVELLDWVAEMGGGITGGTLEATGNPVNIRPLGQPLPPPMLMVGVRFGRQMSRVMVRPEEAVSALRGKLQEMQWRLPETYELIHNNHLMDESRSFAFNHVLEGDLIVALPRYSPIRRRLSKYC